MGIFLRAVVPRVRERERCDVMGQKKRNDRIVHDGPGRSQRCQEQMEGGGPAGNVDWT